MVAVAVRVVLRRLRLLREWATVRLPEILAPSPMEDPPAPPGSPRQRRRLSPQQHLVVWSAALRAYRAGTLAEIHKAQEELNAAHSHGARDQQQQEHGEARQKKYEDEETEQAVPPPGTATEELRGIAHVGLNRAGEVVQPIVRDVVRSRGAVFRERYALWTRVELAVGLSEATNSLAACANSMRATGRNSIAKKRPRKSLSSNADGRRHPRHHQSSSSSRATGIATLSEGHAVE